MAVPEKATQIAPPAAKFGIRHVQTLLMALSSLTIYTMRVNLSVAIVGMTGMDRPTNSTEPPLHEVYEWDEVTQGLVLSSFFWGYLTTQIPAGILTQRYGGHRFLAYAQIGASALTILLPPCAYLGGWLFVCVNRMLQGACQGFVYPSIFSMMGLWAPVEERSTLAGVILGAQTMGPVLGTPLAGLLVALCGWPSCFYYYGIFGMVVALVVLRFGADSPEKHGTISAEERNYITASIGNTASLKAATPWMAMLRSSPFWAAVMTMALQGGVFLAFLTKMPTYLSTVLKFDIKENGLLSALPYLVSWLLSILFSWSCDWFISKGYLTLTQARKVYNSISHVGSGLSILALGFCTNTTLSVVLLTISIGVMSASYPGVQSNFMDLSPNFSGTIFSISNFLSAVFGVLGPISIGLIVTEKGSVSQWRIVYCLLSAFMFVSNLHFVLCSSGDVQPWNTPKPARRDEEEEEMADEIGKKRSSLR